jgi:hypothetical protein
LSKSASHYIKLLNLREKLAEEWKDLDEEGKFFNDHCLESFLEDIDARIEK